jgi:hypothetical protein
MQRQNSSNYTKKGLTDSKISQRNNFKCYFSFTFFKSRIEITVKYNQQQIRNYSK